MKNKVCNSLKIIRSREFDDDSPLLSPLRDGHARIVRVGEGRHDALTQRRQWTLLAGARTGRCLRLSEADNLFGGTHGETLGDDALSQPFHLLRCRQGQQSTGMARCDDLSGHLLLDGRGELEQAQGVGNLRARAGGAHP